MAFLFSRRSLRNLNGVHEDLVKVAHRALAITPVDFVVIEGLRTKARQRKLLKEGKTTTLNSRHLTGHAIDVVPWIGDTVSWDWADFYPLADAFKQAAEDCEVPIEWGGDWRTFKDAPHFQLPWDEYPVIKEYQR